AKLTDAASARAPAAPIELCDRSKMVRCFRCGDSASARTARLPRRLRASSSRVSLSRAADCASASTPAVPTSLLDRTRSLNPGQCGDEPRAGRPGSLIRFDLSDSRFNFVQERPEAIACNPVLLRWLELRTNSVSPARWGDAASASAAGGLSWQFQRLRLTSPRS